MDSKIKTAVIIAGGAGTRLWPLTENKPKTMVDVCGKPMIYWIVQWLKSYGVNHLVVGVAYKKEVIFDYFKKSDNFGLKVDFSEHTVDGGTAEAFRLAIERHVKDENFIAMNSDEFTNMDLPKFMNKHMTYKPLITMALSPLYVRLSVVESKNKHNITGFTYGKKVPEVLVSCGIYIFNRKILNYIPETGSIEDSVFKQLAAERDEMIAYLMSSNEEWVSVNNQKELKETEEKLKEWGMV